MRHNTEALNALRIASPCLMSWEEMEGDERVRFCGACRLHVYDLSAMDAEEAASLISESSDALCVRLYRRADGTVLTQDCPIGLRAAVRRKTRRMVSSVMATAGVLLSLLHRVPGSRGVSPPVSPVSAPDAVSPPPRPEPSGYSMGAMAAPAPTGEYAAEVSARQ
jgi:hypothetical protein